MKLLKYIWTAIYPPKCVFCRKPAKIMVCPRHQAELRIKKDEHFSKKGFKIFSICNYSHPAVKKIITLYKFNGLFELCNFMGTQIVYEWNKKIPQKSILVPIPLHWSRKIWRGFNQARKIASAIQKKRPDLIIATNLVRIKRTKQQATLKKQDRSKNLKNVFHWKKSSILKNTPIFLIDDVYTSGATMHEARTTLTNQGFTNIRGICFARTKN